MDTPVTKEQLVQIANEAGFSVTSRQIDRWRKNDLLPRSRRIHLGKAHGTRSEYPPETGRQLLALCRIHFTQKEKRLPRIRFAIWLEGYSVPIGKLKESFELILIDPMEGLNRSTRGEGAEEKADNLAEKMRESLPRCKLTRHIKRNVSNQNDWKSLLTTVLQLLFAQTAEDAPVFEEVDIPYSDEDDKPLRDIFIDALGLRRATTDRIGDAGPGLSGDVGKDLNRMSEGMFLSMENLEATLNSATIEQLEQARTDAKAVEGLSLIADFSELLFGRNAFGLSLFQCLPQDLNVKAHIILFYLSLRKSDMANNLDMINQSSQQNAPAIADNIKVLDTLKAELPSVYKEHHKLWQLLLKGKINPEDMQQRGQEIYERHKTELDAFWEKHPELR